MQYLYMVVCCCDTINGRWCMFISVWINMDQRSYHNPKVEHIFFCLHIHTPTHMQHTHSVRHPVLEEDLGALCGSAARPILGTVPQQRWWTCLPVRHQRNHWPHISMHMCVLLLCSDQSGRKPSLVFISSGGAQPTCSGLGISSSTLLLKRNE